MKDTWTKPKGVVSRVGSWDGWGRGAWWEDSGENCLNNTKKELKKKKERNV